MVSLEKWKKVLIANRGVATGGKDWKSLLLPVQRNVSATWMRK